MAIFKRTVNGKVSETYYFKFRVQNRQILRNCFTSERAKAERIEAAWKRKLREGRAAEFLEALDGLKGRRACCTIGEICGAWESEEVQIMKDDKGARRVPAELRRVVAYAKDLWAVHKGGVRGVRIGERIPDKGRIDALPASVLSRELVREYFKARSGGVLNVSEAVEGNVTINSTLRQARTMFSRRAMSYLYGKLTLPDVSGFMTEPLLPVEDMEPNPVREKEFAAMLKAAADAPAEVALVNMILRQTGLRSGSVEALHASWLEKLKCGYWCHVRVRKGRTALYSIPISRELAAKILRRRRKPAVVLPDGTPAQRHELVHKVHNEWVKRFIGGAGERVQGNHRLRDTVATALLSWLGMDAAKLALGHADEKTTQKHYARLRMDVSDAMKAELGAWMRIR